MKQNNLIDDRLNELAQSGDEVAFVLRDGAVIKGRLAEFDNYVAVVDGGGQSLVYRHSILKVVPASEAAARPKPKQAPAAQKQDRPEPSRKKPRPPKKQHAPAPKPVADQSAGDLSNPMADQMLKWLKSQKGGG